MKNITLIAAVLCVAAILVLFIPGSHGGGLSDNGTTLQNGSVLQNGATLQNGSVLPSGISAPAERARALADLAARPLAKKD